MNAGKSIELIKVAYNYEERGKQVLTLIPATDDRYGTGLITSRIGIQREAMIVGDDTGSLTPPSSKILSKRCKRLIFLSIS